MSVEIPLIEVMAASCSAHRVNAGFLKKEQVKYDLKYQNNVSNSQMLYGHFFEGTNLEITENDRVIAGEIIEYLKGLSFKAIERNLTDFEKNVLKIVTSPVLTKDQIGIAASLPKVYFNKLEQDKWSDRELVLSRTSQPVGKLGERGEISATIEYSRYIPKTMSYLITASVDDQHIVKFFSDKELKQQEVVKFTAFVKSQDKSKFHPGIETMVNRVKFIT